MIEYTTIYNRFRTLLSSRRGLNGDNVKLYASEIAGLFCFVAHENDIDTSEVVNYLDLVQDSAMKDFIDDGLPHPMKDLIDPQITQHKLFKLTENYLMFYKPGKTQTGPGEFFVCFYDKHSAYSADSKAGYDVVLHQLFTEFKKIPNNFESPQKFDAYQASSVCDRLVVVKPISDKKGARVPSIYVCVTFSKMHWSEAFTFTPLSKTTYSLHFKNTGTKA